jgi:hypothetical protein
MSRPRRDERRSARESKRFETLDRLVKDQARPLLERVFIDELRDEPKIDIGSGDSWA